MWRPRGDLRDLVKKNPVAREFIILAPFGSFGEAIATLSETKRKSDRFYNKAGIKVTPWWFPRHGDQTYENIQDFMWKFVGHVHPELVILRFGTHLQMFFFLWLMF